MVKPEALKNIKQEGHSLINLPTLPDRNKQSSRNKLMGSSMIEFGKSLASQQKLQNQSKAHHVSQRYSSMDFTNSPKVAVKDLNEISRTDMFDFLDSYKLA